MQRFYCYFTPSTTTFNFILNNSERSFIIMRSTLQHHTNHFFFIFLQTQNASSIITIPFLLQILLPRHLNFHLPVPLSHPHSPNTSRIPNHKRPLHQTLHPLTLPPNPTSPHHSPPRHRLLPHLAPLRHLGPPQHPLQLPTLLHLPLWRLLQRHLRPLPRKTLLSTAILDSLALPTSDGSTQGPLVQIPNLIFSCSTAQLLQGLAQNATGLASLGRSNLSLPAQISASLSSPRCFALCLPGSPTSPGAAFFGSTGPYIFNSKIDLSKSLVYTPLIVNPVGDTVISYTGQPSDEYFLNVTSIQINGKAVPINASILAIDQGGFGGTKISTSEPYTVMETSIYKRFVELFMNESSAFNLTVVTEAVEPFGVCYRAGDLTETRVGPAVPTVDLMMHREDVFWRIFGGNSMVRIEKEGLDMWCLGFVDGGAHRRTTVVIGGHQLVDNLVQFDLDSNRFGFSSSVLLQTTTCSNLNITNFANYGR